VVLSFLVKDAASITGVVRQTLSNAGVVTDVSCPPVASVPITTSAEAGSSIIINELSHPVSSLLAPEVEQFVASI